MTKHILAASAFALLAACGPNGAVDQGDADSAANLTSKPDGEDGAVNTEVVVNGSAVSTPVISADFVNAAATSDQFEIQSSQLAQTKASSAEVKKYAAAMIAHHTKTTADLTAAAAQTSPAIVPAPALTAEQQANLDALKAAPAGAEFDKLYADFQVASHTNALATLEGYAVRGDQPMLKAFASKAVYAVKQHLTQAQALAS